MNNSAFLKGVKRVGRLGTTRGLAGASDPAMSASISGVSALVPSVSAVIPAVVALVLAGCASTPTTAPVAEKLDPDTATTVTVLSQPIELFSQSTRAKQTDPFAYVAPFETNKMGSRELFLWVSTPQAQGQLSQPNLKCNGQALDLQPLSQEMGAGVAQEVQKGGDFAGVGPDGKAIRVDLSKLSLSRAPYNAPVPWGTQWYFKLSEDGLKCLASAEAITLEAKAADGSAETFSSAGGRKSLASLDAFERR